MNLDNYRTIAICKVTNLKGIRSVNGLRAKHISNNYLKRKIIEAGKFRIVRLIPLLCTGVLEAQCLSE